MRSVFLLCVLAAGMAAKTPVLLSTDVGNEIDDQWAIAYMLTNPAFDVQGIVSANAPTLPAPSAHATYKVLVDEVENRLGMTVHPPLLEGSSEPLENTRTPREGRGTDFIVETSKAYSSTNRLNVLTIGAATDVASAILTDPTIVDRIRVVAMGFKNLSSEGGKEYNVQNDPKAWQVILQSKVPVVIGSGDVCTKYLALSFQQAASLLSGHGPVSVWLWDEYQTWYFAHVKPLRVNDFSKPWIIWDIITLAYVEDLATAKEIDRPVLTNDLALKQTTADAKIQWIESVDSTRLWTQFIQYLDLYQSTHKLESPKR